MLTATAVWRIRAELVATLARRLGEPLDSYVNGTQTWLTPDGPRECTLEWRLHPVASYRPPVGLSHYDLWEQVVAQLPGPFRLGENTRELSELWDGLECFPTDGDELEPAPLAAAVTDTLGIAPDASGLVDHERIGAEWERARGAISLVDTLFAALRAS